MAGPAGCGASQFGAGMITGWDRTTSTAPTGRWTPSTPAGRGLGHAGVPEVGLWDVPAVQDGGALRERRAHDREREFPNGIRFEGTEGWDLRLARRTETVTASDPQSWLKDAQALAASDRAIITS